MLLNFVLPKSAGDGHEFTIFGESVKEEEGLLSVRCGVATAGDLKILIEEYQSKHVVLHVKSKARITDLLPAPTKEREGKGKEKGEKKKKKTPTMISGSVVGWKGGMASYRLRGTLQFRGDDPVMAAIIVASASGGQSSSLDLDIEADDPDELVSALQEGMNQLAKKKSTERAVLIRALESVYSDARVCVKLLVRRAEWPTLEQLAADQTLKKRIKDYDIFNEIRAVRYTLYVPPITPEEYYHLQMRIEVSMLPYSLDWVCKITSVGEKDALYNKLLASLPEGAFEAKDSLEFPYGALVDCGQVFTYAECYELGRRVAIST